MLPAFFMLVGYQPRTAVLGVRSGSASWCRRWCSASSSSSGLVDPMIRHGVLPLADRHHGAVGVPEGGREGILRCRGAAIFRRSAAATNVSIFGATIAVQSLIVLALAVGAVVALQLLSQSQPAPAARCRRPRQNPTVARILGIPVARMILLAFVINAVLAALASALVTPIYLAKFTNGETPRHRGVHSAAIVGGFNQVRGAIARRACCSASSTIFAAAYLSAQYRAALAAGHPDRRDPAAPARPARPRRGTHHMRVACALGAAAGPR